MSNFTGPLRVEHQNADWRLWRLLEPLVWEIEQEGTGKFVEVPVDFMTDGASVPRVLWWFLPSTGRYLRAAALHDYLLSVLRGPQPNEFAKTKAACDRQFRLAMKACGVNRFTRWLMWAAVRAFGKK